MTVRASLAAHVLVALGLVAAVASGQQPGHAPAARARPVPARSASGALTKRGKAVQPALPDSVLASVEFATGRTILAAADYRTAAAKLDADPASLAPAARRQVLEMMIQQAILNHRIEQAPPRWLQRDSLNFTAYTNALLIRAALDSALANMRARLAARGGTLPSPMALQVMVRDSAIATLHVVYDAAGLDTVAAAFAALPRDDMSLPIARRREILSVLPQVSAADSARVLGRCEVGAYTARELLQNNSELGFLKRPTIRTARDVRELVDNKLYSMFLQHEAHRRHLEAQPDIAALIGMRRQFLTAQRFVQNEAYDRVPVDTATVRSRFERDPRHYDLGATAQVFRVMSGRRTEADSAAQLMTRPGYAELLSTQPMRAGVPFVTTLGEDADTALFARVRSGGVGAIIGPDMTADGWRVFKVMSMTPRRPQTLAEAFVRVRQDWIEEDGDRRVKEILSALAATCHVTVNEHSSWLTSDRPATR